MAGVAGHGPYPLEVFFVYGVDHQHHSSRSLLQWRIVRELVPRRRTVGRMAIGTVHACGGGEHSHRVHEFIDRNSLDDLKILEHVFGHLRPLSLRFAADAQQTKEADRCCCFAA